MIAKGCTCKNSFTFPFAEEDVKAIYITYAQDRKTIIEKTLDDCIFTSDKVSVMLSQEDTLKLDERKTVKIQLRVKLANGAVTKSRVIETLTDTVLKEEVI